MAPKAALMVPPLFVPLLLAHFIADFPLQTGRVFQWKSQGPAGVGIHSGIFVLIALSFSIPLLRQPLMWGYILSLGISHFVIDWLKIFYPNRRGRDDLWTFLFDQLLHTIFVLFIGLLARATLETPQIYLDIQKPATYLCGFVVATFGTSILLAHLRYVFIPSSKGEIKVEGNLYDLLERSLIFILITAPGYLYLFLPIVLLLRWNLLRRKTGLTSFNLFAGPLICAIAGLIMRS